MLPPLFVHMKQRAHSHAVSFRNPWPLVQAALCELLCGAAGSVATGAGRACSVAYCPPPPSAPLCIFVCCLVHKYLLLPVLRSIVTFSLPPCVGRAAARPPPCTPITPSPLFHHATVMMDTRQRHSQRLGATKMCSSCSSSSVTTCTVTQSGQGQGTSSPRCQCQLQCWRTAASHPCIAASCLLRQGLVLPKQPGFCPLGHLGS